MLKVVQLAASRIDEASHVLARAFYNDPLQCYTFPDPEERTKLSPAHFAALARYGFLAGEVWGTEGSLDAVAIWCPPEHREFSEELLERSGFTALPEVIGVGPFSRFINVIDHIDTYRRRDVLCPHWYAMVIGVEPSRQGQGVGGSLLRAIFARADAARVPCYLDTCQPRNVAFYCKQGFEVLVEDVEPKSGLRFWTFLREPR